ncbi:DUF4391 domain-containing protein [Erythrobacter neustonensis]|uniref:DUF4391 domain-containing protein n=1 Tax=Erythrobacter neustonensis TaxID=1112 RepID=A0A192D4I2_9SPHN|nr:DUF4391 domain-containing protein [Erythrobacter neustonensis]ANK12802.1 hypothetical protein A9D12_07425 [Erythrobacter neustonensis]
MTITPHTIREALALPPGGDPARRLPKDVLAEHGAAHAADRKLIDKAIERLDWWATLSPTTIGVAAAADDDRPVPAIQLLALTARAEPTQRLLTIIHRAIPVPIILLTALPGGAGTRVSFAPLRRAERIGDKMVVERLVVAPDCTDAAEPATAAFIASLAVPALPRLNLRLLYDGLVERAEALEIARLTGQPFRLVDDPAARREALARYREAEAAWLAARAAAKREKALAKQIALGAEVRQLRSQVDEILQQLED